MFASKWICKIGNNLGLFLFLDRTFLFLDLDCQTERNCPILEKESPLSEKEVGPWAFLSQVYLFPALQNIYSYLRSSRVARQMYTEHQMWKCDSLCVNVYQGKKLLCSRCCCNSQRNSGTQNVWLGFLSSLVRSLHFWQIPRNVGNFAISLPYMTNSVWNHMWHSRYIQSNLF